MKSATVFLVAVTVFATLFLECSTFTVDLTGAGLPAISLVLDTTTVKGILEFILNEIANDLEHRKADVETLVSEIQSVSAVNGEAKESLSAISSAVVNFNEIVPKILKAFVDLTIEDINELVIILGKDVAGIKALVASALEKIGDDVNLKNILENVLAAVDGIVAKVLEAVKSIVAKLVGIVQQAVAKLVTAVDNIIKALDAKLATATGETKALLTKVKEILKSLVVAAAELVKAVEEAVATGTTEALDNLKAVVTKVETIVAGLEQLIAADTGLLGASLKGILTVVVNAAGAILVNVGTLVSALGSSLGGITVA